MESLSSVVEIYCDGGVAWDGSPGASTIGGTWAWVGVDKDGDRVIERSGFVPATPTRTITNNHTEGIAIIKALEAMPEGWTGVVKSDSMIALGRVFKGWRNKNVPQNMIDRARNARRRVGKVETVLLQGHPTKVDLERGIGKKRGFPVSIHNVRCDELCSDRCQDKSEVEYVYEKYDR